MLLFEANQRIYWVYLLSGVLLLLCFRDKIEGGRFHFLTLSSMVDVVWLVINQLLLKLWITPFFALQVSASLGLNSYLVDTFGYGNFFIIDHTLLTVLFTFTLFVVGDFCKFITHYSFHHVPFLWPFHAVHHSATTLTPLTLYRIHPVEFMVNSLRSFLVGVVISGLFVYLFQNTISVFHIIGVNIFVFLFNIAGSNLRHSSFYLGFGLWERWFISPAQHQIHHSVNAKHFDKNFGSALAVWDRLFNCLMLSKYEKVRCFGVDSTQKNRQTIKQQWWGVR